MAGSCAGYIGTYIAGYYVAFRRDYKGSGRSMFRDILSLQLVEQLPNVITLIPALMMQGALMVGTQMGPMLAINLGSLFGLHKIANLMAMTGSNSMKKAMVDRSWTPSVRVKRYVSRLIQVAEAAVIAVSIYIAVNAEYVVYRWGPQFV